MLTLPGGGSDNLPVVIPAAEYPAGFVFYKMCQAGLLQGLPTNVDVSGSWQLVVIDDDGRRKRFLTKYPRTALTLKFRHVPQAFGRLLAKIGYGHVLTQLDPGDFRPICLPYILGRDANISYIVGGTTEEQTPEPGIGYSLRTAGFGGPDRITLMALIRLLANTHAPAYHVVVGDITGRDRVRRTMQKLGTIIDGGNGTQHWLPRPLSD